MSHLRRHQSSHSITNGFTPGGHIPVGYSYLDRAHSLVTPTRRNVPKGMEGPRTDTFDLSTSSPQLSKGMQAQIQHTDSYSDLSTYKRSPDSQQHLSTASRRSSLESLRDSPYRNDTSIASENMAELIEQLPKDPLRWLPSQVAIYLTYVLGLTPKPIVQDVTAYVRNAGMSGRAFLRLKEKDLAAEGLNLKWRKLMVEAVKKLRKDCLRGHLWSLDGGHAYTETEEQEEQKPALVKQVNANSTGTLKRLRDKKAVREMISSFENIREGSSSDGEDAFIALGGMQKRGSVSSLRSISSSQSNDSLNRPPMQPVYGEGYVRERAESFSSLREQTLVHHVSRPLFTREQLQDWFGDLSESEVQGLADELDAEDDLSLNHTFNRSTSESSINSESCSSESMPTTPPAVADVNGFNLTPIDANLVKSIVGSPALDQLSNDLIVEAHSSTSNYIEPLRKDILIDEDQDDLLTGPRPGAFNGGKTNPYRRSTYEEEELEALGLDPNVNTCKFDTAKKVPRIAEERGAAQDSVRVKRFGDDRVAANIRDMFATATTDLHHHASRDSSADDEVPPLKTARTVGTFGRAALMTALQQANETQNDGNKRAEDESEWGVTFSRKASRRNTLARADGSNAAAAIQSDHAKESTSSAASRMSQLFNPVPLSEANLEKHEKDAETDPETLESPQDKILLPLTTLEPDNDGKGSIKKRSMVLVDRRKFEALAKRMGVLEEQLAGLEAISLPPDSDLGSMGKSSNMNAAQVRAALDEVFTIPAAPFHHEDMEEQEDVSTADEKATESANSRWSLVRQFGIIPSYSEYLCRDLGNAFILSRMYREREKGNTFGLIRYFFIYLTEKLITYSLVFQILLLSI